MKKELIKGNKAIAETAIRVGLEAYFGYPITPQTEVLEWMAERMPGLGRAFVQAESELGAINMVYGAAATGVRAMTSSAGPGISLMQEGLSFIAATELPMVLVNVMRGGPGLGNVSPSQADYNQACHGGGHGDYHPIVLAPANVQEAVDMTALAFDLADKYRSVCIVLIDGTIGQIMEPAVLPEMQPIRKASADWMVTGEPGRERRYVASINMSPPEHERLNLRLLRRAQEAKEKEVRYQGYYLDGAHFLVVGFGSAGRVALSAVRAARAEGIPVGLLRPITVKPFPDEILRELSSQMDGILVVEMNTGQMLDDVRLAVGERAPVDFYGRMGGVIPFADEVLNEIRRIYKHGIPTSGSAQARWLDRMQQGAELITH